MSKAISIEKIIEATLDGIDESMNIYQKWSGGECYEISSKINKEINDELNLPINIDVTYCKKMN